MIAMKPVSGRGLARLFRGKAHRLGSINFLAARRRTEGLEEFGIPVSFQETRESVG